MPRNIEDHPEAARRRRLLRLLGLRDTARDNTEQNRSVLRELRRTLWAVVIGVALFLVTYLVFDLGSTSKPERSKLFEYTIAAPVLLEMCAEQSYGDPSELRKAARLADDLLREARERSAAGLITVPRGSTMATELARLSPELTAAARARLGDTAYGPSQWRSVCAELLNDFRSVTGGWARLQASFPQQVRELGLKRPTEP